jgi:hypothetical protein
VQVRINPRHAYLIVALVFAGEKMNGILPKNFIEYYFFGTISDYLCNRTFAVYTRRVRQAIGDAIYLKTTALTAVHFKVL